MMYPKGQGPDEECKNCGMRLELHDTCQYCGYNEIEDNLY